MVIVRAMIKQWEKAFEVHMFAVESLLQKVTVVRAMGEHTGEEPFQCMFFSTNLQMQLLKG